VSVRQLARPCAEVALIMAEAKEYEGQEECRDRRTTSCTLVVCYTRLAHMLQYLLTTQAVTQMWIVRFDGDFAAMARLQGLCSTLSSLVAFAVGPALGSLTDTIGRKPVLYLPPLFDLLQRLVVLPVMTVGSEVLARTALGGVVAPLMGVFDAALGDLHVSHPMELGTWQSRLSLAQTAAMVLTPMLSSTLAVWDLRLPLIVSAGILTTNLVVTKFCLAETLEPAKRKPLVWRSSSPFSLFQLFRRGPRLRCLCCMLLIDNLIQPVLGGHNGILQIYQADSLGWGLMQRGQYESLSAVLQLPGFVVAPSLMRKIGLPLTARIGVASTCVGMLISFFARSQWHFYAAVLCGSLGKGSSMSASPAMSAMVAAEGASAGFGQGELNAMVGNLRGIVGSFSGLLWGAIYTLGSRRGTPSLFFLVGLSLAIVQLAISSRSLMRTSLDQNTT
jgi:hypothetical protein